MSVGFIILRHVTSVVTNSYWLENYNCIRRLYPDNKIVIIDDNSDDEFISQLTHTNMITIKSEFKGRGELLPYYYFLKYKWFDTAVILHDSVFIKKHIDFNVNNYKFFWDFEHNWDNVDAEKSVMNRLTNNAPLMEFHNNKQLWKGCFGCMAIVKYDFLKKIDDIYTLSNLLNIILTRNDRCNFERVLGCMFQFNSKETVPSVAGNIHAYCAWGYTYKQYIDNNGTYNNKDLPIIKVWTGR